MVFGNLRSAEMKRTPARAELGKPVSRFTEARLRPSRRMPAAGDETGEPIHLAASNGHVACVDLLLSYLFCFLKGLSGVRMLTTF